MGVQRTVFVALDVQRTSFEPRSEVVVRQHDKGARILIDVLDGGLPLDADGVSAHLMCDTRGGLVESELERNGSRWSYTLGQDLTACHGELAPYVEMRRGGDVIAATGSFRLRVDRAADLTAPQAQAAQSRLDGAVEAWEEFDCAAREAEEARADAERLRAEAESGRDRAESARVEKETEREKAEGKRAEEWAATRFSIGEVSEGEAPGASVRQGPGGRTDVVLDLVLVRGPKGEDGAAFVEGLTDPEVDALFDQAGDPGGSGGQGIAQVVAMGDDEIDAMFGEVDG